MNRDVMDIPDLFILDVMLTDGSGWMFARNSNLKAV